MFFFAISYLSRVCGKKLFGGGRVWGVGCGVWGFIDFQVVNYLGSAEKVFPGGRVWGVGCGVLSVLRRPIT
ncbi:MAG: hypothetical protein DWQ53_01080 [Microcystis flos-aquae DF17]|nr:MAG: hypothetical protein DWQ53_01080 [Microcystis flos-aquae DF17]